VVASGRKLGGYSGYGGLETKRFLLGLEGALLDLR
jgi:O6-methylguanine-DNA--protein-cysteine methyltransferase